MIEIIYITANIFMLGVALVALYTIYMAIQHNKGL